MKWPSLGEFGWPLGGTYWRVSLLREKQTGAEQTETYTWDSTKVSNQDNKRPGSTIVSDSSANAPRLTQKVVVRDGGTYTTTYSNFDIYGNPQTIAETGPNSAARSTAMTYTINTGKWIINQVKDETITFQGISYPITRSIDANGNLLSENRYGAIRSYTYTSAGSVNTATNPRGKTTTFTNYLRGIPQTETHPISVVISRTVSPSGNVLTENDGLNSPASYSYDGLNRITGITFPTGAYPQSAPVTISYPNPNTRTLTRGGFTETTTYDGFGRVSSINRGGITRFFAYDALGRKISESNPNAQNIKTTYTYDVMDRVIRTTHPDTTYVENTYSGVGANNVRVQDESGSGGLTTYNYRSFGNPDYRVLMGISPPESTANVTLVRNHGLDKITSVTQSGITRSYGYGTASAGSSQEYLVSITDLETGPTTLGRDANGNMITKQVGASGQTQFGYDDLDRLTGITYPANANVANRNATMTYFTNSTLNTVSNGYAARAYVYDQTRKPRTETLTIGNSYALDYGYDANEQLNSITYPVKPDTTRTLVDYAPDVLGRPTKAGAYVTGISYFPNGQISTMILANGVGLNYGQDSQRLWPVSMSVAKSAGPTHVNTSYGYADPRGNVTSISDSVFSDYNRSLGYDGVNRLTIVNGPWGNGAIAYAGNGNIASQSFGSFNLSYAYDSQNRLASTSGSKNYAFGYDAYGNVASNGANTFTYDDALNLRTVSGSNVSQQHEYDGKNMRVSSVNAGVTTYFMYG